MKFKRSNSNILGPCQSTDQPSWWLPIGNPTKVTLNKYGLWPVGSKTMLCSAWKLEFHARTRTSQGMEMIWGLWSTKVQVTWVKILVSLLSKWPQTTLRAFYLIFPFPLKGKAVKYQWLLQFSFFGQKLDQTPRRIFQVSILKFIHSEKATKFCEISTLDLPFTTYSQI